MMKMQQLFQGLILLKSNDQIFCLSISLIISVLIIAHGMKVSGDYISNFSKENLLIAFPIILLMFVL